MTTEDQTDDKKEPVKEPTMGDKLRELLAGYEGAPSAATIDGFKASHGDIFLSALNDDELFIFRALNRKEHRELNARVAEGKVPQEDLENEVVKACLLWKSIKDLDSKAGTIPSLFEQVMQNSNFLAPQLLSNLVTKL